MILPSLLLAITTHASAVTANVSVVDALMAEVTEACLLPDMATSDPREVLKTRGWQLRGDKFEKQSGVALIAVEVSWPASANASASCSFRTSAVTAFEAYDFFRKRMGEPNDIPWSDKAVAGWKIKTNGHRAGVYVGRDDPRAEKPGLFLHILQG